MAWHVPGPDRCPAIRLSDKRLAFSTIAVLKLLGVEFEWVGAEVAA